MKRVNLQLLEAPLSEAAWRLSKRLTRRLQTEVRFHFLMRSLFSIKETSRTVIERTLRR